MNGGDVHCKKSKQSTL
jgi:hypothetical protein